MSLKTRLIVLTSLCLLLTLLLFNAIAYLFFIRSIENNEINHLIMRSKSILNKYEVHEPKLWNSPGLLNDFILTDDIVRIVDPKLVIQALAGIDTLLIATPVHYSNTIQTEIVYNQGTTLVFVRVPIYSNLENVQIATLEIGRNLTNFEDNDGILLSILFFTSLGILVVFALGGNYFYSRYVFNPLQQLAGAMQSVQKNGDFRRLPETGDSKNNELVQLVHIFNEMIARLEEHLIRQNQFVLDASHELRTPLTIIESYSDLLRRWGGDDPKLREEAIQTIHSEAIRLKGMTSALLDLVVHSPTNEKESWSNFNFTELIKSVVQSLQVTFAREINLVWPLTQVNTDIYIHGSPEKIRQLFLILMDNAIKYSDSAIQIEFQEEPASVIVKIIDNGVGIPEEELGAIFERFYRVDKARSRKTGGVGLGLPIALNIAQLHSGTIAINSTLGQGTMVTIQLNKNGL